MSGSSVGKVRGKGQITKGNKKMFEIMIHNHDCGDGLTGIHICQIWSNCTLKTCAVYVMLIIPQQILYKAKI